MLTLMMMMEVSACSHVDDIISSHCVNDDDVLRITTICKRTAEQDRSLMTNVISDPISGP